MPSGGTEQVNSAKVAQRARWGAACRRRAPRQGKRESISCLELDLFLFLVFGGRQGQVSALLLETPPFYKVRVFLQQGTTEKIIN